MNLTIDNLSVAYGDTVIVKNVSFSIVPGEVAVIVGPNGCGKSTLLKSIARLIKPKTGSVYLDDMNVWETRPREVAKTMSLLPQQPVAPSGITVEELIRYGRHPHQGLVKQWSQQDYDKIQEAMVATDVLSFRTQIIERLSGGQKQRAWLAMCLAQDTPIVLLDEPTSALDLGHQVEVLELIRELAKQGRSFLLVLHDLLSACRYGDKVIAMQEGSILAEGEPRAIVNEELIRQLYDIDCDVLEAPIDGAPIIIPKVK